MDKDKCEVCEGKRGGIPGNENVVDGIIMCDYCHADGGPQGRVNAMDDILEELVRMSDRAEEVKKFLMMLARQPAFFELLEEFQAREGDDEESDWFLTRLKEIQEMELRGD